ncbi:MAG: nodulation protein S NodS [Methanobacteriota archaeon]|nr:MAG: nodulation protein S NodS [Euryarchaeota archaeon]|tara:strand:+ start:4825 stop:5439 length:615 start_codon:yes stop_codon:yes gene_type:complete
MEKLDATDVFSEWVSKKKDEGMEIGHAPSVNKMLSLINPKLNYMFAAVDVGCGNGWVCRKLSQNQKCKKIVGIDGSEKMIIKAKEIDPEGNYIHAKLPHWKPQEKFDLIHSMEFLYYLKDPLKMLKDFFNFWLNPDGLFIAGIDYYLENEDCHSWPEKLNVHMTKLSINDWKKGMLDAGFKDVEIHQVASNENFIGTLVMFGKK